MTTGTGFRHRGCGAWALAGLAIVAASASAQTRILVASPDPDRPSRFTVDFPPELGGPQSADIISTQYALKIDEGARFAAIQAYHQSVEPLQLGPFNTGDIVVRLAGKSNGSFQLLTPDEGQFVTEEVYNVFFEGDLSPFGLFSPVPVESTSVGDVTFLTPTSGTIRMAWEGDGEIQNPNEPGRPFRFTYRCEVNSRFIETIGCDRIQDVRARCAKGDLTVAVRMRNARHDGQSVAVDVSGEPFAVAIRGHKARARLSGREGPQTVNVITEDPRCQRAAQAGCGK